MKGRKMARTSRTRKTRTPAVTPAKAVRTMRTSARKALDAGMQAASSVRQAATGVGESAMGAFNALVKQGAALEARSRHRAVARAEKARDVAYARAKEARVKTVEAVSHLEKVFEQRVSKAISKLGIPTSRDVRMLSRQVSQLQANVDQLNRRRVRAAR
jgi:poly(hydroxyalkanoate) granule-associated protein